MSHLIGRLLEGSYPVIPICYAFDVGSVRDTPPWPTFRKGQIIDIIWGDEPEYQYEKLRAPGHIRLLLLHRRNPVDAISCTLFEVDSKPLYEAISYTRGGSLETGEIQRKWLQTKNYKKCIFSLG
jgi:hypothetical protein